MKGQPVKITIQHLHDGTGCLLKMDDDIRIELEALGSRALQMIQQQDPLLWSHAADTGLLKIIRQGACVMRSIGVHTIIPLTDANAHSAFVSCCVLALRFDDLPGRDRRTLRRALVTLAECCTVQIDKALVPPFSLLPKATRAAPRLAKTYRKLLNHEPISLADLLRLLKRLEKTLSPELVPLICDLRTVTEGLRAALQQTRPRRVP